MECKFLSSTNYMFECFIGVEVELNIQMAAYYEFDPEDLPIESRFNFRRGVARTSAISNVKYEEISMGCTNITITTRNSEYVFQHGKPSDKPPLTNEEILNISIQAGMHLF